MRPFGFVFFFGMSLSSCAVDEVRWPSSTQSLDTYLDSQRWDCWDTLTSYACTDYVCDVCIRHTCMTVRLYLKNMCYAAMHIVLLFIYIHIGYRLGDYFCIVYLISYTHNYVLKTMYVWSFFTYIHIHIYAYVYIIYLYIHTCSNLADVHSPGRKPGNLCEHFFWTWDDLPRLGRPSLMLHWLHWSKVCIDQSDEEKKREGIEATDGSWIQWGLRGVFDQTNMRSPGTCTRLETYMCI